MTPKLSIVIPVLSDEEGVLRLLAQIPANSGVEIVVADGGAALVLDTAAAGRADVILIRTRRGRAYQMNAGAAAAHGEWLLFLHADCRLPPDWLPVLLATASRAVGGWFQFALDDRAWQARLIEHGVALRVRLFRLPYGDQGIFVRQSTFE